jgi:negative regulator of flagellin synthesis FlgM
MMIDRINSIDPIQPDKKPGRMNQINKAPNADSVNVSPEALVRSGEYHAMELVSAVPSEVRTEFITDLKKRMSDPSYLNDTVISGMVTGIMDTLNL